MIRKTVSAALTAAVIAGSALIATTGASFAGGYGGYGYGGGYGYNHGYNHRQTYRTGYYQPRCFYKKVKVHGYYGWHWERVRVCN